MSNLKVVEHYPTINSSGWYRNAPIQVYFNKPIDPTTIKWNTLSINDSYSFSTCVGNLSPIWASGINLSGVTSGVTFVPTIPMLPNTEYNVFVYGKPNSILAKDHSEMQDTYSYSFVTGTGYYTSTGEVGVPSGVDINTYSVNLSGLNYLQEDGITTFYVYSTSPKNQTPNVSGLSNITITMTGDISTSESDLSGYINIVEEGVL